MPYLNIKMKLHMPNALNHTCLSLPHHVEANCTFDLKHWDLDVWSARVLQTHPQRREEAAYLMDFLPDT